MNKTKKNIMLQSLYQICILVVPFITAPYVSRVLGSEQVGIYSFHHSIINYFMIAEMLGLESYGARTVARVRDDKALLNRMFTELACSHFLISGIVLFVYLIYCFSLNGISRTIAFIQILYIIGQTFNITWLFTGLSEHKTLVIRNILIKLSMTTMVFVFVRDQNDLLKYILILAGDMFMSQTLLWGVRKKYASFTKVRFSHVLSHLKPQIILFVSIIASSVYRMMDKTMIGYLGMMSELGRYEYADKIIKMPLSVITGVGTVMLSRTSSLFSKGQNAQVYKITHRMLRVITIFASLMVFGMCSYGTLFCTLYLGSDFSYTGTLLAALSITLLFISWNSVMRTQYYIPQLKDRTYVVAVVFGAVLNIILNFALIPKYSAFGASIATVLSYFSVSVIELFFARKELNSLRLVLSNVPAFLIGSIPFLLSLLWKRVFAENWMGLIAQMIIFCIEFVVIVILYLLATHNLGSVIGMFVKQKHKN